MKTDGRIILGVDVDTSGLKSGLGAVGKITKSLTKSFAIVGSAAATAIGVIAKQSVSAYGEYQQMVGGIETIFKKSADKVLEYANNAYRTVGVSANDYMSQVTSFSASLLQSLGGDTDKAADVANMALIDMADNANKMGTEMYSIQNAYQGFAKQNYTMLDNLKLGYGGTKTEMERLLSDAEKLTGVEYDISNLADVYNAIHAIQVNLGITGTTAQEAGETITGSAAQMKAAWQNVLTAVAGGGDLDKSIDALVETISTYFDNIVPVVEKALSGIGKLIEKVAPQLVKSVAKALIKAIPELVNAVYEMIVGLVKGIYEGILELFRNETAQIGSQQAESIAESVDNQNQLTAAVKKTAKAQEKTLAEFDDLQIITGTAVQDQETIAKSTTPSGTSTPTINEAAEEAEKVESGLMKLYQKIAEAAKTLWNTREMQTYVKAVKVTAKTTQKALSSMLSTLVPKFKTFFSDISVNFKSMIDSLKSMWIATLQNFVVAVNVWGEPIIESVTNLVNSIWNTAIAPVIEFVTTSIADALEIIKQIWNAYGLSIWLEIGEFFNNIVSLFQGLYDNFIEPILKPVLEAIKTVWNDYIKEMLAEVTEFAMNLVDTALIVYNKFVAPIVDWLMKVLKPVFETIGQIIGNVLQTILGTVARIIKNVIKVLNGLLDFIKGVFTGNWKLAWNGIVKIFEAIWDTIWSVFKGVINLIIDGLNALWSGLYLAIAGVVNGVGKIVEKFGDLIGQDWGFSIPKNPPMIPRLATGAVIPGGREFMAVLGDQPRGQTNIEAPAELIYQMAKRAVQEAGGTSGDMTVVLEIDGREFGKAVVEQGNRENRRVGTRLVVT